MKTRAIALGTIALGLAFAPALARAQANEPPTPQNADYDKGPQEQQQQGTTVGQSHDQAAEQATTFDSLPQASKDTINKYLKGGTVDRVEKTEQKGKSVYEAHCTLGNKNKDKIVLMVDENGKLIGSHTDKGEHKKEQKKNNK